MHDTPTVRLRDGRVVTLRPGERLPDGATISFNVAFLLDQPLADPTELASTLEAVHAALGRVTAEHARLIAVGGDTAVTLDVAGEAHRQASDYAFLAERLALVRDKLEDAYDAAVKRLEDERKAAERAALVERRDALAAKLRQRYPAIASELAELLAEAIDVDKDCACRKLPTTEATARDYDQRPSGTSIPIELVRAVRLPSLRAGEPDLWPPPIPPLNTRKILGEAYFAATQKIGAEAHAPEAAARRAKELEATAATRPVPGPRPQSDSLSQGLSQSLKMAIEWARRGCLPHQSYEGSPG